LGEIAAGVGQFIEKTLIVKVEVALADWPLRSSAVTTNEWVLGRTLVNDALVEPEAKIELMPPGEKMSGSPSIRIVISEQKAYFYAAMNVIGRAPGGTSERTIIATSVNHAIARPIFRTIICPSWLRLQSAGLLGRPE